MNKDESPIKSTSVTMGHNAPSPAQPKISLEPWTILVCADLGFTSTTPVRVTIADWDGFMSSCGAIIRGTVSGAAPLFIEHPVTSLRDLRAEAVSMTPDAANPPAHRSPASGGTDAVDRILSMTDVTPAPDTGSTVESILAQPFFNRPAGSWISLKHLVSLAGRRRDIRILVLSAPAQDMPDHLNEALDHCSEDGLTPDLLLYDYPLRLNTADMTRARSIAVCAEQHKTIALAAIDRDDPLIAELAGCDTAVPILQEQRFIPYRRLRNEPASRCLVLCAPDVQLHPSTSQVPSPFFANTLWMIAAQWIEAIVAGDSPILPLRAGTENTGDGVFGTEPSFCAAVMPAVAEETAAFGLAVLPQGIRAVPYDTIPTVVDDAIAGAAYTCFGVNMLVNRTMRLAGIAIAADGGPRGVRAILEKHLAAYGILTSESDLTIEDDDGEMTVELSSSQAVGGEAVHFQFQCS